ncbi:MAG: beta strand repeat-containing protein [Candidatus Korobacteraceae bacterium]
MKLQLGCLALAYLSIVSSISAQTTGGNVATTTAATQTGAQSAATAPQVPRLVKFSGTVQNFTANEAGSGIVARDSASVPTNVIGVTFSLYSQQTGGVALWSEVQNVRADNTGRYTVQLGSTRPEGLPVELFNTAQAQWLGVRQEGQAEQPRIMLLSVPYALEAADAETFGGKPPSAYMSALNSGAGVNSIGTTLGRNGKQAPAGGGGTTNYIALWTSSTNLGDSVMYQSSNNIGIGTTSPGYPLTVSGNNTGAIISVTQAGSGIGVNAYSYSTSGGGTAVLGKTQGKSGIGVRGESLASTGDTIGVYGTADSDAGVAVQGTVISATGDTVGVQGNSASDAGVGVYGFVSATTGTTVAVQGITKSPDGIGVSGSASSTSGSNFGVQGDSDSPEGVGVYGNASASSGDTTGVYGLVQSSEGDGVLGSAVAASGNAAGVRGVSTSDSGTGVYGEASDTSGDVAGVYGTTASPAGQAVYGHNTGESGMSIGVYGVSDSASGVAILGASTTTSAGAYGVVGNSASPTGGGMGGSNTSTTGIAYGVIGETMSTSGFGVAGKAQATTGASTGVVGQTASSTGFGVVGNATSTEGGSYGVAGMVGSPEGTGVYGTGVGASEEGGTVTDRPLGAWGDTNQEGGIGVLGTADDTIAVAGYNNANVATGSFQNDETTNIGSPVLATHGPHFAGICLMDVSGNLACNGTKSAVVPVDGGTRQVALYAVEAPENWFEDAGSARLSHGSAVVRFEPTFAQTINGGVAYHVFLTPKGDCKGLYVTNETADGFEVAGTRRRHSEHRLRLSHHGATQRL